MAEDLEARPDELEDAQRRCCSGDLAQTGEMLLSKWLKQAGISDSELLGGCPFRLGGGNGETHDVLWTEGYHVDAAATFPEAITLLDTVVYDLVIADWRLPEGNGLLLADIAAELGAKRWR